MKLVNKTGWSTADLSRIVRGAMKEQEVDPETFGRVVITFMRGPIDSTSGCARIGSTSMTIRIPNPHRLGPLDLVKLDYTSDLLRDFASTCEHELLHCKGLDHDEMREVAPAVMRRKEALLYAPQWLIGLTLSPEARPEAVSLDQRIAQRAEKAARMVEKWERKVKLAKTRLAKWTKKVRYYAQRASRPAAIRTPRAPKAPVVLPEGVLVRIAMTKASWWNLREALTLGDGWNYRIANCCSDDHELSEMCLSLKEQERLHPAYIDVPAGQRNEWTETLRVYRPNEITRSDRAQVRCMERLRAKIEEAAATAEVSK